MTPETRYAKSGDVHIAYQVVGDGPVDLVFVAGWITHLELAWEDPVAGRFLRRLASFSRLILFDKRGIGLSDRLPVNELPILEERMDDVRAVMDAAGFERAALLGVSEGGAMSALFAATYPDRVTALILYGSFARTGSHAMSQGELDARLNAIERDWPDSMDPAVPAPSLAMDEGYRRWWRTFIRHAASPGAAIGLLRMNSQIDVRDVLHTIRVPTLVIYRRDARFGHGAAAWREGGEDVITPASEAAVVAEAIPGARIVELPGADHFPWAGDVDSLLGEIEEFLTGARQGPEPDRVLATILFTDIVGSNRDRGKARRQRLAGSSGTPQCSRQAPARAVSRPRAGHRGRRLPRLVRRSGEGDSLCPRDRRVGDRTRPDDQSRDPHRRIRAQ
jgi:pimeloyl-ACP methyl ester carboxylesterase